MGGKFNALLLIGAGGHAAVVLDALRTSGFDGPVSIHTEGESDQHLLGEIVHRGLPNAADFPAKAWQVHVAIGNNAHRKRLSKMYMSSGFSLASIVHPRAFISRFAEVEAGSSMLAGAIVNARAMVGAGSILNTNSLVEHDCKVGDWSHLGPGAVMTGSSSVGQSCWIGANAVLRQGSAVGNDIIVGANSLVLGSLTQSGTYIGIPARLKEGEKT